MSKRNVIPTTFSQADPTQELARLRKVAKVPSKREKPSEKVPDQVEKTAKKAPLKVREPIVLGDTCAEQVTALLEGLPAYNEPLKLFYHPPSGRIAYFGPAEASEQLFPIENIDGLANLLELEMHIPFERWNQKAKKNLSANPPPVMLKRFLALPRYSLEKAVPAVNQIVTHPTAASDGTLVMEPGLHPSGIYYRPDPRLHLRPIPSKPSGENVKEARALVEDIISDFPLQGKSAVQAFWGLLLSPLLSHLVDRPWPLFHVSATTQGSGKTKLISLPGLIYTGRAAGVVTAGQNEEEMRKKLTSILQQSDVLDAGFFINFDNVKGRFSSESLEAFLTSAVWKDRLLGSNRMGSWKNSAVCTVTGNNLTLSEDLERRQLMIRLVPNVANPSRRSDFKYPNLERTVVQKRSELLWAMLVIVQNWLAAGRPQSSRRLGSFEDWSANMGGLLEAAGIGSEFLLKHDAKAIVEQEPWPEFVRLWLECPTVARVDRRASELIRFAEPAGIRLREGNGKAASFGRRLQKIELKVFDTHKGPVQLVSRAYGAGTLWSVEFMSEKNSTENSKVTLKTFTKPYENSVFEGEVNLQSENREPSQPSQTLISPANELEENLQDLDLSMLQL